MQRRVVPDAGYRVHGGAALQERFDEFRVTPLGGPVQGRHAVSVRGVGVLTLGKQGPYRSEVAEARGVGDRRRHGRSRNRAAGDQQRRGDGAETT